MQQIRPFMHNEPKDDHLFERPRITLLNDTHWLHIQNRYQLSPRELQVAQLVCRGFNNEEIANRLDIRHGTVKTHLRNIYRRIRVKNKITLLLKFVSEAAKFSKTSQTTPPPIPVLDMQKNPKNPPKPSDSF